MAAVAAGASLGRKLCSAAKVDEYGDMLRIQLHMDVVLGSE